MIIEKKLVGVFADNTPFMVDLDQQYDYVKDNLFNITEEEIKRLFFEESSKKEEEVKAIKSLVDSEIPGYYYSDGALYKEGINLSIPKLLAEELGKSINTPRFTALEKFWQLCSLNPNPQARHDLFTFLQGGKFTITSSGLFIAYRNVDTKQEGSYKELSEFVYSSLVKVKAWKKSPKNYVVVEEDGQFSIVDVKRTSEIPSNLGTLAELEQLGFDTVYTDRHTGTFTIKINEPVMMDRGECDSNPDSACSYGLMCSPLT